LLSESLLEFLLGGRQPEGHGLLDQRSGIGEGRCISWGGGVEVNTVCAVVAVDVHSLHSSLSSLILDLGKTCVLPRVFNGIGENDLISSDVEAAIPLVVEVDSRRTNSLIEDVLAELKPIGRIQEVRSHGDNRVRFLEPAELGTHLVHPLTLILINVIGNILEDITVGISDVSVALNSILVEYRELLLKAGGGNAVKDIAHALAFPILDGTSNGIGDVAHEVTDVQFSPTKDGVDVVLLIWPKLPSDGLLDVVGLVPDEIDAGLTAAES
jgi:hypothetical protein